jgi:hypothetical protein
VNPVARPLAKYSFQWALVIVLSLVTKFLDSGSEDGEVQLSLWATTYSSRLRQLIEDPVPVTLPLLSIRVARHKLLSDPGSGDIIVVKARAKKHRLLQHLAVDEVNPARFVKVLCSARPSCV